MNKGRTFDNYPVLADGSRVCMPLDLKQLFCRGIRDGSIKKLSDCHHMHMRIFHKPMAKKTFQRLKVF